MMNPGGPASSRPKDNTARQVDQEAQKDDIDGINTGWKQRLVSTLKQAVVSPIKMALHRLQYHPRGMVKKPLGNRIITSQDIQHLPESQQLLRHRAIPGGGTGNSKAALFSLKAIYYDTAIQVIQEAKNLPVTGFGPELLELERDLQQEKQQEYDNLHLKGEGVATREEIKQAENLSRLLKSRLEKSGISQLFIETNYRRHISKELNKRNWDILHSIHKTNAGTLEHCQTPASKMQILAHEGATGSRDVFETSYGKLGGICSHTTDSDTHAVNLWTSSFKSPKNKFNYCGVRHGIHSAVGIKDPVQRKTANLNRARESLVAALTLKPELLKQGILNPEKSIHVDMSSVSLVTPDFIRRGASSEARMLQEQVEAFRELSSQQPLKLTVVDSNGKPITIRATFRLALFNFGVNEGAQGKFSGVVGGWDKSDTLNREGLDALIGGAGTGKVSGIVGDFLARQKQRITTLSVELSNPYLSGKQKKTIRDELEDINQKRKVVHQLVIQIRSLFNSKAHHHEDRDAYKMPVRIALLMSLAEGVPLSNCKSGKDRTGMLDAEIKLLATMIEQYGEVPEPGMTLAPVDAQLFREILLHGQNLEIQKLNTGAEGYKTEGVKSIDERMGKAYLGEQAFEEYRAIVRGLSGAVKA
ncbi:hypothetical protein [Endozoicomonas sp. Mp262]|uniref:inositol phosphate phosphatase SopB n=1 Tax=Endozoicomonas sp. Mp262 TaxID=2919499 RepID=UPI0021D86FB2